MSILVAETKYGRIRGVAEKEYTVFKGIPYAQPPVGELRWRAPQPLKAWEGIYEADHFSAKSAQGGGSGEFYEKEFYSDEAYQVDVSEDSLYLNIWTPAKEAGEKLPVAFWIHGGAYLGGSGSEMEFDGAEYAKRGIILVTINYRVNVYGFLAHPWLCEESPQGVSGNYGILDQIAALTWVYENIEAFGGDRDKITVFGQSAGAMSVQTLVSTELTGSMIAGAIMQSGGSYGVGLHTDLTMQEAMEYGEQFVEMTGAKSLAELRAIPMEELERFIGPFIGKMFSPGGRLVLSPNIDNYLLKDGYYRLIDDGKLKKIPYLLGSTKNDLLVTEEHLKRNLPGDLYQGSVAFSHKLEEAGRSPAYVYYFTRDLPGDEAGAFHSAELWYMFGTLGRCWRPMTQEDFTLNTRMLDYWANFMKTGNPNGSGLEEWRPCSSEDAFVQVFDV